MASGLEVVVIGSFNKPSLPYTPKAYLAPYWHSPPLFLRDRQRPGTNRRLANKKQQISLYKVFHFIHLLGRTQKNDQDHEVHKPDLFRPSHKPIALSDAHCDGVLITRPNTESISTICSTR